MNSTDEQIERHTRALRELAYAGAARATRKATVAGLKVMESAIRTAAPVGPTRRVKGKTVAGGQLRRGVGSRFIRGRVNGVTRAKVGLNVGKGRPVARGSKERRGNLAPHAHLPALGTRPRWRGVKYGYRRQRGKASVYDPKRDRLTGNRLGYTGLVTPNDFVQRASRAAEPAATQAIVTKLDAEIRNEIARVAPGGRT